MPAAAGVLVHQVLVTNVQIVDKNGEPSRDRDEDTAPTKDLLVTLAVDDDNATKILDFAANGNVWLGAEQKDLAGAPLNEPTRPRDREHGLRGTGPARLRRRARGRPALLA